MRKDARRRHYAGGVWLVYLGENCSLKRKLNLLGGL